MRLAAAMLVVAFCATACGTHGHTTKIGVLLPRTPTFEEPLDWAAGNAHVKLVWAKQPGTIAAARAFADDPSIAAVIGPETSDQVLAVADLFVAARKPLVTPSATSADIDRAFGQTGYVWRTVGSDVGQVQAVMRDAARSGARSVALLTSTDLYGSTFFDWFGFSARELGLRVTGIARYDEAAQPCTGPLQHVLATHPDVLLAVPSTTATTNCVAKNAHGTRVVFSDGGEDPAVKLPISGIAPAAAPGNGFVQAFRQRFGTDPTPYAAQSYDAVTLLAYAAERARGGPLAPALAEVVGGRGRHVGWNATTKALSTLAQGGLPNLTGAGGPLDYSGTDPTSTAYATWRSTPNGFATTPSVEISAVSTPSAKLRRQTTRDAPKLPPRKALWALLVAASSGEQNYRHQADVLAQYQVLRANGVPDDHIVLVLADDLGPKVQYTQGGPNLRAGAKIDYHLDKVTASGLLQILAGRRSAAYPQVIGSGPGDDVYVYIAGHGNERGVYMGLDEPIPLLGGYTLLAPKALAKTVTGMRYRRLLIAVEACQSGVLGEALHAPNALLLAAASPTENSLSTNYDPARQTWLADAFSFKLWQAERSDPAQSLDALYTRLYLALAGQHVTAYGGASGSTLGEFVHQS